VLEEKYGGKHEERERETENESERV